MPARFNLNEFKQCNQETQSDLSFAKSSKYSSTVIGFMLPNHKNDPHILYVVALKIILFQGDNNSVET